MRIAFYAPLKSPDHAVPSGDRRMARLLIAALRAGRHHVVLASRFRSYDGRGDPERQQRLAEEGARAAAELVERYRRAPPEARPDVWFTYHLYHKAPDWLGPAVSAALDIPYVVAEASHAPKRKDGPWALGHVAAAAAIGAADAVFGFNPTDAVCLRPLLKPGCRSVALRPFLDGAGLSLAVRGRDAHRAALAGRLALPPDEPWLLAVAMLRPDKLDSFRVLGAALASIGGRPWRLLVAGGGAAEVEARAALAAVAGRTAWLGQVPAAELPALYAASDLLVWPAVREAYGMALLEGQAAGLPAVAGDTGGVGGIVRDGVTGLLTPVGDAPAFARAVAALLDDADRRREMGTQAMLLTAEENDLRTAARAIGGVLAALR
jgi:glycosyltransferase involved in cell wall biosynthesis